MKIVRYNKTEVQTALGSTTAPQKYLHAVLANDGTFAIYVWDTREVVETGKAAEQSIDAFPNARDKKTALVNLPDGVVIDFAELKASK